MQTFFKTSSLMVILFSFVSCGARKPMVRDLNVSTDYVNGDVHLSLNAQLSIGNARLPSASFPVLHPRSRQAIGMVSLSTLAQGGNLLDLNLNLSTISTLSATNARLPNGSVLPLIGLNDTIVIPLGRKVELYLSFGDGLAALGVSIPFKTLDSIGRRVGHNSLFPVFNIKEVFGAAGLFFSRNPGENGFGFFCDISNVLDPLMFLDITSKRDLRSINYSSQMPVKRVEDQINRELLKIHRKSERLELN